MLGQGSSDSLSLGQLGSIYVDNTTAQTGSWGIIYAVTDTVFASLTSGTGPGGTAVMLPGASVSNLNSMQLPAGGAIYGLFTGFTLTSGKVVAYKI